MVSAMFAVSAQAQTTYTLVNPAYGGRVSSPWSTFGLNFTGGQTVSWLAANTYNHCAGDASPYHGFIYLNGVTSTNCVAVTSYTFSGSAQSADGRCKGPGQLHASWNGGSVTLAISYYYGGSGRAAGCFLLFPTGVLSLN
jgi:hypothetical protein